LQRPLHSCNIISQVSNRRFFEQIVQGQVNAKRRTHTRNDLDRQQRVAAQFKEIIMNTNRFNAQQRLSDVRDLLFGLIPGSDIGRGEFWAGVHGDGSISLRRASVRFVDDPSL